MGAGGLELDASRFLESREMVPHRLHLPTFPIQGSLVNSFLQHIDSVLAWTIANLSLPLGFIIL